MNMLQVLLLLPVLVQRLGCCMQQEQNGGEEARGRSDVQQPTPFKLDGVFVINLDRSPERMAAMHEQLVREGIPYERVPAVDGANLKESVVQGLREKNKKHRPVGRGDVGCSFSHRKVWSAIKRRPAEEAHFLVLEDDVVITDNFTAKLAAYAAHFVPRWDCVYLGMSAIWGERINEHLLAPVLGDSAEDARNSGLYALLLHRRIVPTLLESDIHRGVDFAVKRKLFSKPMLRLRPQERPFRVFIAHPPLILHNNSDASMSFRRAINGRQKSLTVSKYFPEQNYMEIASPAVLDRIYNHGYVPQSMMDGGAKAALERGAGNAPPPPRDNDDAEL